MKEHPDCLFFHPLRACGWCYNDIPYDDGLNYCLDFLSMADEMWVCPGWEDSTGACIEFGYAKATGKDIYFADGLYSREEFKEIKDRYVSQKFREINLTYDMINPKHLGIKSKPTPWIPSDKPKIAHYWVPKYKGAWF